MLCLQYHFMFQNNCVALVCFHWTLSVVDYAACSRKPVNHEKKNPSMCLPYTLLDPLLITCTFWPAARCRLMVAEVSGHWLLLPKLPSAEATLKPSTTNQKHPSWLFPSLTAENLKCSRLTTCVWKGQHQGEWDVLRHFLFRLKI